VDLVAPVRYNIQENLGTAFSVNRHYRLTRSTDFQRVRRFGKSYAHPLIVLIAAPAVDQTLHFGIAAGRSLGGAVQRNRAKRLLRAALQPLIPSLTTGWDVVLLARQPLKDATYHQAQEALLSLIDRAHLRKNSYVG